MQNLQNYVADVIKSPNKITLGAYCLAVARVFENEPEQRFVAVVEPVDRFDDALVKVLMVVELWKAGDFTRDVADPSVRRTLDTYTADKYALYGPPGDCSERLVLYPKSCTLMHEFMQDVVFVTPDGTPACKNKLYYKCDGDVAMLRIDPPHVVDKSGAVQSIKSDGVLKITAPGRQITNIDSMIPIIVRTTSTTVSIIAIMSPFVGKIDLEAWTKPVIASWKI